MSAPPPAMAPCLPAALPPAKSRTRHVALLTAATMGPPVAVGWFPAHGAARRRLAHGFPVFSPSGWPGRLVPGPGATPATGVSPSAPGKPEVLAGHTSALLLSASPLAMAGESLQRLWAPVGIAYDEARRWPSWAWRSTCCRPSGSTPGVPYDHAGAPHDHPTARPTTTPTTQPQAACLHVLADAATSVCAIGRCCRQVLGPGLDGSRHRRPAPPWSASGRSACCGRRAPPFSTRRPPHLVEAVNSAVRQAAPGPPSPICICGGWAPPATPASSP